MWFGELEISSNCKVFPRRDFVGFRRANGLEFVLWSFGMKERYLKNIFQNIDCHFLETPKTTVFLRMAASASTKISDSTARPRWKASIAAKWPACYEETSERVEDDSMDDMGWHWMTLEIYTNLTTLGSCVWNLPMKTGNAGECCDRYCRGGCGGNWGNCHRGARSYRGCCSAAWQQLAWRLERCEEYPFGIGFM